MAEVRASAKYIRVSPFKLRPLVDEIKGKPASEAQGILRFSGKGVAQHLLKVLNSAVANASNSDLKLKPEDLYVTKAFADEGPTMKRIEYRAMGRVNRLRKRSSHITIVLSTKEEEEARGSKS